MNGYPFFYGNEILVQKDLDQDEKFLIFSLDSIAENSELNLTQVTSLPILVEPSKLTLSNEFSYEFCDQISQFCATFHIIPETKTVVLDYNGFCQLVSESDTLIRTLSSKLEITNESAIQQAQRFFTDKTVIVQAKGVQNTIYKVGAYIQSAGSAGVVANTLAVAKLAGASGLQILKAQPYLAVAIPTTGAMFFYGCAAIIGNNQFGKALTTTGDALALPMKGVEIMWNSYGNPIIQKVCGIPVILNMTQTFKTGPGYTVEEIVRYIPLRKESVFKALKGKIIKLLS